jgi:formamidopyrimidine-DNA glycosylase
VPELPEVETTRRGVEAHVVGHSIRGLRVRQAGLRWPVPKRLAAQVRNTRITGLRRRAKYLLLDTEAGTLLIHLGMSGSLRLVDETTPPGVHDHIDLVLDNGTALRFRDPRRFGTWLWGGHTPESHPLLASLGPEPLSDAFSGEYLYRLSRGRRLAVKSLLMDSRAVAGVGNIYANEALFVARIHPGRAAGRIGLERYRALADAVKQVLERAIRQGGTTLRDFVNSEGEAGYFQQSLLVYGQPDKPCPVCGTPIRVARIGQRSTFYCPRCQR